jgi:hypothetical protein
MLLFYQVIQGCHSQLVELQDDNKLLEQLVTSLLSSTTLYTTFHTDELLVSKAVGKCNVPFHIVHLVSVVGMWVNVPVPPT